MLRQKSEQQSSLVTENGDFFIYQEQSKKVWNLSSLTVIFPSPFREHKLILWDYNQKLVFCDELKFKPS